VKENQSEIRFAHGFAAIILFFIATNAFAQVPFTGKQWNSEFRKGVELFNREKYASAIKQFDAYLADKAEEDFYSAEEAEYLAALSAVRLFNPDAEYRMLRYLANHPGSYRTNEIMLTLADYFYQDKNY
jgi:TolA-binding protein